VEVGCIFVILVLVYIGVTYYKKTIIILQKLFTENMLLCAATTIFEWLILCHCMRNGAERFVKRDLAFNFIVILCVALLLLSISLFFTYQQIKTESMIQMEIQKCLKNQYHELKELYEVNSRWVHDAKHELILVGNCLEENDLSKAHDSVQRYLQRIKQTEKKVWSNFSFVDFMLNYKKVEMDKRNIKFVLRIELQHINIPEEELAIIIGNLLDNAIEAAEKCEESERFIHLKIQNVNHMLLLSVENSCVEQPEMKKGMFISTKTDHGIHGWGIKSVKQIVETYNGEMDFKYDEKHFQVEILI
jgi:sensor histidine kinase regulating citrate/malate metabolism